MPSKKPFNYLKYTGIAFQMIAIILGAVLLGIYLDKRSGNSYQVFTIVFSLLGVIAGLYLSLKDFIKP